MRLPKTNRQKEKAEMDRLDEEKVLQEIRESFCVAGYDVIDIALKEYLECDKHKQA